MEKDETTYLRLLNHQLAPFGSGFCVRGEIATNDMDVWIAIHPDNAQFPF